MKNDSDGRIKVPRFKKSEGFYTDKKRSIQMSNIGQKDTKPEIALRKALWSRGIRYRINYKKLPGKPDIVITKSKVVIFVDGEFWHGYNWKEKKQKIKSNRNYWIPKIERNIQRDRTNNIELEKLGYHVIRFWGHEIKNELKLSVEKVMKKLE